MFKIFRAIINFFGAEYAQRIGIHWLRFLGRIPGERWLLHKIYGVEHPSLEREVFGLHFRNPIGMAAGFDRNGEIFSELGALGFGFVEIGTVTPQPQNGNPRPRVFMLPEDKSILNRIGLANKGLERVMMNLRRKHTNLIIGCNIGKNTITPAENAAGDYLKVFRNLYQYVDYFTVNVCYNTTFKQYVPHTKESISAILEPLFDFRRGQNQYRPILLKISPDLSDSLVDDMTDVMLSSPLDGIVATNATVSRTGMTTDAEELGRMGAGAISGAPLTKRAIEVVARIYARSQGSYPIIGVGGLMTPADVKAMLAAGASLVQLYTGFVYGGAKLIKSICRELIEDDRSRQKESTIEI